LRGSSISQILNLLLIVMNLGFFKATRDLHDC
jgi:hypothetical protein